MCSTGNYWSAQWEFRCSTGSYVLNGKLLCAQLDIIEVLNGMSTGIIMCSTGHYWGVQWEVMSSTGNYNVFNWTLLECSMGIYNLLNWTLLGCSMGIQVLNRNLGAQWKLMVCILLW